MTSDELKIDKRIVERALKHGRLDAAEYQRMLSALPDLSDKVWRKPHPHEAAAPVVASAPESEPPNAAPAEVVSPMPAPASSFFSQS
jgi:hypothetical protein